MNDRKALPTERLRSSSAVLLTRGRGREVYLVERARELRFFGGYWACPGGVVEPVDRAGEGAVGRDDLARCAERELFEETGLLLPEARRALASLTSDSLERLRSELLEGGAGGWAAALDGERAPSRALRHVCRLTTPAFALVRYATEFWQVELDDEQPDIRPGELVDGAFFRPEEALARWEAGELFVVPPVLFLLRFLAEHPLEEGLGRAAQRAAEIADGRLSEVRHTPGVFTAPLSTPTIPPATTTNTYLVGEHRVFVVDPATWDEGERARLFRLLDAWRAEGRELAGVLVTHHHRDHVGSVGETARRYELPVLAHPLTLERLPEPPRDSRPLSDGERLELGRAPDGREGWGLEVWHTPGHDRGHLAFVEDRYRALIAGDLVSTLSTIVIDPPEGHLATYLASLRRLRDAEPGVVYPAHGPAARSGIELLDGYLAHRRRREEKLLRALARAARTSDELLAEVYDDTPAELLPLARRSLLAGLEKLVEEGRVAEAEEGWEAVQ